MAGTDSERERFTVEGKNANVPRALPKNHHFACNIQLPPTFVVLRISYTMPSKRAAPVDWAPYHAEIVRRYAVLDQSAEVVVQYLEEERGLQVTYVLKQPRHPVEVTDRNQIALVRIQVWWSEERHAKRVDVRHSPRGQEADRGRERRVPSTCTGNSSCRSL